MTKVADRCTIGVQAGDTMLNKSILITPSGHEIDYDNLVKMRQLQIEMIFDAYKKNNDVNEATFDELRDKMKLVCY